MAIASTPTPEILSKKMDEIRHLLTELAQVQNKIRPLQGQAHEKVAREWRELSETLCSKLAAVRYFKYDHSLFIKFQDAQKVQVVIPHGLVALDVFDAVWMDTLPMCEIVSEAAYLEARNTVPQSKVWPL